MIHSLIVAGFSVLMVYALFSEELPEAAPKRELKSESFPINDSKERKVVLSCQTCRKLKNHIEIEPNLFQCVKCKRQVDIRVS